MTLRSVTSKCERQVQ